jgi:hypothetical protein
MIQPLEAQLAGVPEHVPYRVRGLVPPVERIEHRGTAPSGPETTASRQGRQLANRGLPATQAPT